MIHRLLSLPRWAQVLGLIAVAVAAFLIWDALDDRAAVSADRATANAELQSTARKADAAARGAVDQIHAETEKTNDDARKAAAGSDDPLRAGLDRLRAEKGDDRAPSR